MNKIIGLLMTAGLLVSQVVTAPPASAQKQTVESAHEFLRITFSSGGVKSFFDNGRGENVVNQSWYSCTRQMVFAGSNLMPPQYDDVCGSTRYGTWGAPAYNGVAYSASGRCAAQVKGNAPSYSTSFSEGKTYYTRDYLNSLDRGINWTKVAQVKASDTSVNVTEGPVRYRFIFPSPELAARAAYAMDFIKTNCDPASSTGF